MARRAIFLGLIIALYAPENGEGHSGKEATSRRTNVSKPAQGSAFGEQALINTNNLSMWFRRDGYSAGNPYTDIAGVTYPRSTDQVIYRDGLIWGGGCWTATPRSCG